MSLGGLQPILYKKDTTGAIRQWHIEIGATQDCYRMVSGQYQGQLVASEWTYCKPVNVAKKNERSTVDQCAFEVKAAYVKKKKEGYVDTIEKAELGEKRFFEPMLAKKYEDYTSDLDKVWNSGGTIFAQPKLDGIRCLTEAGVLATRTGEAIPSCGHVAAILQKFPPGIVFDGELYNHELHDNFNEIASLVRKTKGFEKVQDKINAVIQYHIYDVYLADRPAATFKERTAWLAAFFTNNLALHELQVLKLVPTHNIANPMYLDDHFGQTVADGYEGQIVRLDTPYENKRTSNLLKRKEFQDAEFIILDVLEGIGNRSGMAGALLLDLGNGRQFQSGIKGGRDHYRHLLARKDQYIGKPATIRYFHLTPDGVPRFPVAVDVGRTDA